MKVSRLFFIQAFLLMAVPMVGAKAARADDHAECPVVEGIPFMSLATEKDILATLMASPYAEKKGCYPESERKKRKLEKNGCWFAKYGDYVAEMIPDNSPFLADISPPDIAEACPNYATMGTEDPSIPAREKSEVLKARRRAFWNYLLQAVAAAESDYQTQARLLESFRYEPNANGGTTKVNRPANPGADASIEARVAYEFALAKYNQLPPHYSEGLFQVTQGNCNGVVTKNLLKPRDNIRCAVAGLNRQLFDDQGKAREDSGLFSLGSQWAVLKRKKNLNAVEDCLRKIPGARGIEGASVSKVDSKYADNVTGCRGYSGRKVLSQFWEGYEWGNPRGKNLCGLTNHFPFCGELKCAKLPKKPAKHGKH
jgi:hypothetical protein